MYSALVGPLGFPEENVIVLYADGLGLDLFMPVDGAATKSGLTSRSPRFRGETGDDDLIFTFSTDGGGFNTDTSRTLLYGGAWDADCGRTRRRVVRGHVPDRPRRRR